MISKNDIGKDWLLLTGLSRESAHWGGFVPLLQSAFPDASVTLLDLPGAGCLYKETSPATIQAIMKIVHGKALEQGNLKRPVIILGLSLGAMVAWEWMLNYPDEIAGAALIGPSFAGVSPFYQRIRWQSYGKIAILARQKALYDRELAILQLISNRRDQYPRIMEDWLNIQNQRPVSMKNIWRQSLAGAGYRPGDRKPRQPVLLLNSKGDRLVAPECSEAIAGKWNLELRTHPWAGHDLPLDDGAWVVLQLINWLNLI